MSKVAFIASSDRKYNIGRTLSLVKSEIIFGLRNSKRIVVKPSCPSEDLQLASTHLEALDAVFEFIMPYAKTQVTLAEGTEAGNTLKAFNNYGYFDLQEKHDFAIVDLNTDASKTVSLVDKKGNTIEGKLSRTLLDSDYLISVSPLKTHNEIVYAGAVYSAAVGGLIKPYGGLGAKLGINFNRTKDYKSLIRQSNAALNENIARIYRQVPLKLAILDGYESMEGNGPTEGEMVPAHYAIASSDPVALDWLGCNLMNLKIEDIGYLSLLGAGDINNHFIIGDDWQSQVREFKTPPNFENIRKWQ